jgi:hypothetical protein
VSISSTSDTNGQVQKKKIGNGHFEERRLRMLRRIFRGKRDGVTGEWRKLHYEELNDLYCSPDIFRVI